MKKSDAEAVALKILLMQIESGKITYHQEHIAKNLLRDWTEFLQNNISDDINLDLLHDLSD